MYLMLPTHHALMANDVLRNFSVYFIVYQKKKKKKKLEFYFNLHIRIYLDKEKSKEIKNKM
jgi:hypothetical protein